MATKKECKRLEIIAHVVSDAVGLEELAVIQQPADYQINDFIQENVYAGKLEMYKI